MGAHGWSMGSTVVLSKFSSVSCRLILVKLFIQHGHIIEHSPETWEHH